MDQRFLANPRVAAKRSCHPVGRRLRHGCRRTATVVLLIDQSKVSERHQILVLAVRVGERALPLAWRVQETRGAIGFVEQRAALESAARLLPAGITTVLMGIASTAAPT